MVESGSGALENPPWLLFLHSDFAASGCFLRSNQERRWQLQSPSSDQTPPGRLESIVPGMSAERLILHRLVSCGLGGGGVLRVSLSQLISRYRRANSASARCPALVRPFPLLLASFFITSQLRIYMMSGLLSPARRDEVRGRCFKEEVEESTRGVSVVHGKCTVGKGCRSNFKGRKLSC